ncbi:hypothetical protein SAMN06295879_1009 [Agreia bicolorata]|uniref:Uncharacterized protein n=1 Tax=Agreia bicolorata TaxID=110935 RepID=A0A1T4XBN3_9MICO|nr:hypothetical protein [Agreia bicolorata]SKA86954.1 hypothetical protein SAMN06295879_1009 [Agreia bicolorata]
MTIIETAGSQFTWQCVTCGVASRLNVSVRSAALAYDEHMASHERWDADLTDGYDEIECFDRAMARMAA